MNRFKNRMLNRLNQEVVMISIRVFMAGPTAIQSKKPETASLTSGLVFKILL